MDFDLQGVTEPAAHLAARGVGDGFDGDGAGGVIIAKNYWRMHWPPK